MKKYLAITAALALALTACGQTAADSTPTPTAATEAAAAPAEQLQSIGSGTLRLLTAAADGVYYQAFNDCEINYTDTMGRALIMPSTSRLAMRALSAICPAAPMTAQPAPRGATAT